MGRPPSNGGPSFRFNQAEIAEMEAILQAHKTAMPAREVLVSLAEKFSNSEERKGKIEVQMKQVWNWFQNRRYAIRAKAGKSPGKLNITQMTRDDHSTMVKGVPQPTQPHTASSVSVRSLPQVQQQQQHPTVPSAAVRTFPQAPQTTIAFSVQSAGRIADNSQMEYEAKSARDGAWYDVSTFLSHRSLETGDPEVLVRFAGFGAEEDEWVNVGKNVRQRSLPCEASECVAVLPADLILCFQEGKEQALYFDAHVLDAQRRRHDVRGCRCRFLVRYDHDQSEEIVALRKICRRPETDYRLQQLHAVNHSKNGSGTNNIHTVSTLRVYPPADTQPKQLKVEPEAPPKRQKVESTPTVLAAPPGHVPQDQQNVDPTPAPSEKVETMDEVPLELHKGEVSDAPQVAGPLVPPSAASEPPPPHEGESVVAQPQPQEEPMVCSSSVEAQAELPQVQPANALMETKAEWPQVQPSNAIEGASETKAEEVQVELPQVQPSSAIEAASETKAEVPPEVLQVQPATAVEAVVEMKAEVPEELPRVQPASAPEAVEEMKAEEVQVELPQVQPSSAVEEALETKAEVPAELLQVQPATASAVEAVETKAEEASDLSQVQPATAVEAMETKNEVPVEMPEVQPATGIALETVETKAEEASELPQVQPATEVQSMETEAEVPAELPQVQPATEVHAMETEAELPAELPQVQPASALIVMETEAEEPVCVDDSNVVEEAMEMEAEIEQPKPKASEIIMDTNDGNDNKLTDDMEQV